MENISGPVQYIYTIVGLGVHNTIRGSPIVYWLSYDRWKTGGRLPNSKGHRSTEYTPPQETQLSFVASIGDRRHVPA